MILDVLKVVGIGCAVIIFVLWALKKSMEGINVDPEDHDQID